MTTAATHPTRNRTRSALRFLLHYAEMAIAMMIGMFALAPVWTFLWPGSNSVFEIALAVMATNMAIGMAVPMLLRRHSWRSIIEMSAAMYLAFLVVLVPYWLGAAGAGFVMLWGHVLMLVAMFAVMLLRPHGHEVSR
jgi:flagellar biosynthetic protein FliP